MQPTTLLLFLLSLPVVLSTPLLPRQSANHTSAPPCTAERKLQRKAWHTLTPREKKSYIDAEICLFESPAVLDHEYATNFYEDLVVPHQVQAALVHNNGFFLPFHRYYIHAHEMLLREKCGYKGAHPYWDEVRDSGNFSKSIIFDPETGFGGDGVGRHWCVQDGPFAKYEMHIGPGQQNLPHCLTRNINDEISLGATQPNVTECQVMDRYDDAWPCIEGFPHRAGHSGVGGEMSDPISSPVDPLFWLHHAWLDLVWWQWQSAKLPERLTDIIGPRQTNGKIPITLNDTMNIFGIVPDTTVAEMTDIRGDRLCYEYIV